MRAAVRLIAALLVAYLLLCAAMFFFQRRLQYHPDAGPMQPAAAGLPQAAQETLATPDGEHIVVWWVAPQAPGRPVYLYLHGNGANLHARAARFGKLVEDGAGLMAVSWRGYGGSTGSPSEAGLLTDARTALAELRRRAPAAPLLVYGESLGSTVAVMLAAEAKPAGVLLDSSFVSALAVAQDAYPWLPVGWLLRDRFRADLAAPKVAAPVLQVHCRQDPVTPLASAQALNQLFPARQDIVLVEGRCHVPSLRDYLAAWRGLVDRAAPPR
jgi:pimeloyl-ACP methyl ester carboxylesterase